MFVIQIEIEGNVGFVSKQSGNWVCGMMVNGNQAFQFESEESAYIFLGQVMCQRLAIASLTSDSPHWTDAEAIVSIVPSDRYEWN